MTNASVDVYLDMMDIVDGVRVLYNSQHPGKKYECVSLLDEEGDETEDEDSAVGGVVKIADECFMVFTLK